MGIIKYNGHTWKGMDDITLKGDVTGTSVIDEETGEVKIQTLKRHLYLNAALYEVATLEITSNYSYASIDFYVSRIASNGGGGLCGLLRTTLMSNSNMTGLVVYNFNWVYANSDVVLENFILAWKKEDNVLRCSIYFKGDEHDRGVYFEPICQQHYWKLTGLMVDSIPSDYTQIPSTLAAIQNPVSHTLGMKYFSTGGAYAFSFRFSCFYDSPNGASRVPILIVVGSQSINQTSMIPVTLYSNGTLGGPADPSPEIGTITAEDGLVTISTEFNNRWSIFLVLYPPALVDITEP